MKSWFIADYNELIFCKNLPVQNGTYQKDEIYVKKIALTELRNLGGHGCDTERCIKPVDGRKRAPQRNE